MIDEAFVRLAHDFIIDDILVDKYLPKATNNDTRAISINQLLFLSHCLYR